MNGNTSSNCYTVLLKNDEKLVYCNITKPWNNTVTKPQAYAAGFVMGGIALILMIVTLRRIWSTLMAFCCKCGHSAGCCSMTNFGVAAVLRMVWKVIDIAIDTFTYYKLGSGGLIDSGIYRNPHVLACILAFTFVGIVGLLLGIRLIYLKADELRERGDLQSLKLLIVLVVFLFEDSIQMFLEYFWIQKYVTIHIPSYLVVKDIIIAVLALHTLVSSICTLRNKDSHKEDYALFVFGVLISLAEFLRVRAVLQQYKNGTFNYNCLQINEGRLWQSPFAKSCMSKTDYAILVLTFVPFLAAPFLIEAFKGDIESMRNYTKRKFTSFQTIENPSA